MKYTIKEILPGQIRVEYEDNSWAIVPISANSTMEEIDHAVSQYDPDFLPSAAELINSNISIGLERTSAQKSEESLQINENISSQLIQTDFGISEIADYFSLKGDTRLKDALYAKIEAYVTHNNFSIDALISNYESIPVHYPIAPNIDPQLDNSWEDIVKQAEEELNAGKS